MSEAQGSQEPGGVQKHRDVPPQQYWVVPSRPGTVPLPVLTYPLTPWARFGIPVCFLLLLGGGSYALLMTVAVWTMRGDISYCTPPDHSGPCTPYQDSSTLADLGTAVSLVTIAGAIALHVLGRRYARSPERTRASVICAVSAVLVLALPYGLFVYGGTT